MTFNTTFLSRFSKLTRIQLESFPGRVAAKEVVSAVHSTAAQMQNEPALEGSQASNAAAVPSHRGHLAGVVVG